MRKVFKSLGVIVGAVVITTLAIEASDVVRGLDGSLSGNLIDSDGPCGAGAVQAQFGDRALCIDMYEVSPSDTCPVATPTNAADTQKNVEASACRAESVESVTPWRFVNLTQAQQVCARAGKRLMNNDEWYRLSSSIADVSSCVLDTNTNQALPTGSTACVTPGGVHDLIGNVWEWIDGEVKNGVYDDREMPESGFVQMVDSDGVVLETGERANTAYGEDYAITDSTGVRGIIRGGFYGSGSDGGLFAINAAVPLNLATAGVGFRCVRDIY